MPPFVWLLDTLIDVAVFLVLAQAIMSWLVAFNIVNMRQRFIASIWFAINRLTEPIYRPIRRIMPNLGGIDITPMIVIIGLLFLRQLVYFYLV